MDWNLLVSAVIALCAIVALGFTAAQLRDARIDRRDDYYRKLTPFLSFETTEVNAATVGESIHALPGAQFPTLPAIKVYADGGGYAFNVEANLDQTNATGMQVRLVGQNVLRYVRDESGTGRSSPTIAFSPHAAEGFRGVLKVKFVDMLGITHRAEQAVRFGPRDVLETTDAIRWMCGAECRVHPRSMEQRPASP